MAGKRLATAVASLYHAPKRYDDILSWDASNSNCWVRVLDKDWRDFRSHGNLELIHADLPRRNHVHRAQKPNRPPLACTQNSAPHNLPPDSAVNHSPFPGKYRDVLIRGNLSSINAGHGSNERSFRQYSFTTCAGNTFCAPPTTLHQ